MSSEKPIKSPLNYTGGKHKLLPQIVPLFPKKINTFVDLFGGGFSVGVNVSANRVIYNDIQKEIVELFNYFKENTSDKIMSEIESIVKKYKLSDSSLNGYEFYGCNSSKGLGSYNKDNYTILRSDYNKGDKSPIMFYTMVVFAFCNQIRFNSKGEFNMTVNKRDFNNNIKKNLIAFVDRLKEVETVFINEDFKRLNIEKLKEGDLVYCDPPYLISTATYNENGGWTNEDDENLLKLLDRIDENNIKFALSNVLYHKGQSNDMLIGWSKRYNVHYLDKSYSNCSYQLKDSGQTVEVLITNY